jgi:hypothetical protein
MTETLRMDTGGVSREIKESSWSEMVKSVDAQRKTLPWNPKEVSPVKRISLVERRLEERETNPVLMQYRDSNRENARNDDQFRKSSAVISRANNIKKTTFNFLSHQGNMDYNIYLLLESIISYSINIKPPKLILTSTSIYILHLQDLQDK